MRHPSTVADPNDRFWHTTPYGCQVADLDLSETAIAKLSSSELVELLERLQPDDPNIGQLDIDVIGRQVDPRKLKDREFAELLGNLGRLADGGAELDLSKMDATNFAKIIARASDNQIKVATEEPALRARMLDELFRRMSSHFLPARARDGKVIMQFRVNAGGKTDDYAVTIENRECSVAKELADHPKTTITLSPASLLKLATGNAGAKMMFVRGKVKISGSIGFAAGFMNMFEVPKA